MAAFLYSEAGASNAEGNTNHSGARTAGGRPWRPRAVLALVGLIRARPGRPLPPWLRVLGTEGGVPVYGGTVYCQHAILEYGFIDQ